jgi:hypothetical protein
MKGKEIDMSCTRWKLAAGAAAFAATLGWAGIAQAQLGGLLGSGSDPQTTLGGQAAAVRATVLGVTTSLSDSGTLSDPSQPVGSGQTTGSIPGLLSAESLHAAAMGWTDQVASQASLSNLALTVAGVGITAEFLGSQALAVAGAAPAGASAIEGLSVGGVSVSPTGIPNQLVSLPGLSVILNEQTQTAGGIVVNALRVKTLDGLTDVAVGTSRAGI